MPTIVRSSRYFYVMIHVQAFEFNPFAENTYVLWDETLECIIFDPGCYTPAERDTLRLFIENNNLKPVRLINTHCHLDHVFGNRFVAETWQLALEIHRGEIPVLERFEVVCKNYGIPYPDVPPPAASFLEGGDTVAFGNSRLKVLFTPGHSPASISFYNEHDGIVIAGDVLFYESIGRTDLPGGNFETLMESIHRELFTLPGETIVYPGHGPATTIRHEREYNPFV